MPKPLSYGQKFALVNSKEPDKSDVNVSLRAKAKAASKQRKISTDSSGKSMFTRVDSDGYEDMDAHAPRVEYTEDK